ncbi:MAG: hypothetical protein AAF517_06195, partial [Planctomycetota bacterium]
MNRPFVLIIAAFVSVVVPSRGFAIIQTVPDTTCVTKVAWSSQNPELLEIEVISDSGRFLLTSRDGGREFICAQGRSTLDRSLEPGGAEAPYRAKISQLSALHQELFRKDGANWTSIPWRTALYRHEDASYRRAHGLPQRDPWWSASFGFGAGLLVLGWLLAGRWRRALLASLSSVVLWWGCTLISIVASMMVDVRAVPSDWASQIVRCSSELAYLPLVISLSAFLSWDLSGPTRGLKFLSAVQPTVWVFVLPLCLHHV